MLEKESQISYMEWFFVFSLMMTMEIVKRIIKVPIIKLRVITSWKIIIPAITEKGTWR